jgi:hypothetical protein
VGQYSINATYTGGTGYTGSSSTSPLVIDVNIPITVVSAVVDGNSNAIGTTYTGATGEIADGLLNVSGGGKTNEHSMVESVLYTFNQAVLLTSNAVSLSLTPNVTVYTASTSTSTTYTGGFGTLTNGSNSVGTVLTPVSPTNGLSDEWILTFTGSTNSSTGVLEGGGIYNITLNNTDVTDVYDQDTLASNRVDTTFRLFGNSAGYSTGTGQAGVTGIDLTKFNQTYQLTAGQTNYHAWFDDAGGGTGQISGIDLTDFNKRYQNNFSGFTPTI